MMYTQQLQHLPAGIKNMTDLVNLIESKLRPKRYAIITHDKEKDKNGNPKEPDLHIMLSFDNARSLNSVAKILGDKPQYVEAWVGDANNGYAYLVHATRQAQSAGKHRYDPGEVTANFDYAALVRKIGLEVEQAKAERAVKPEVLLDMLYTGAITKQELEQQLTGSLYARYRRQIEDVWAKRLQNLAEEWREEMIRQSKQVRVIWIYGPAGTGKTYVAIALAVKALKNREVKKIILSRPAVEAGEKLGFLPGDMKDKIDPYLQPLYDALEDMVPAMKLKEYMETKVIQIAPLAFMRGRTLNDAVIVLDEAQNTTTHQMKMFLTRLGMNSKMVVTGDVTQIDLPRSVRSGLLNALRILRGVKGIGMIEYEKKDIVRHPLVQRIVDAYEQREKDVAAEEAAGSTGEDI